MAVMVVMVTVPGKCRLLPLFMNTRFPLRLFPYISSFICPSSSFVVHLLLPVLFNEPRETQRNFRLRFRRRRRRRRRPSFSRGHATLHVAVSVSRSVGRCIGP